MRYQTERQTDRLTDETHLSLDGDELSVQLANESLSRAGCQRHNILLLEEHSSGGAFLHPLR